MTNEQMIFNAAINSGIFTAAEATAILSTGRRLPLHTYSEWKRLGYQVKEGERAALVPDLWRFSKNKASEDENGEERDTRRGTCVHGKIPPVHRPAGEEGRDPHHQDP